MREPRLLFLSQADVTAIDLQMSEIIELLQANFREKGEGRVEMPAKPGVHTGEGNNFIYARPAYIPAMDSDGVRWGNRFPSDRERGLCFTGLRTLKDPETGPPIAGMGGEWIRVKRTAGCTVVAAPKPARSEAPTLLILGCSVQGRTETEALDLLLPVERVCAYDVRPQATAEHAEYTGELGLEVAPADSRRTRSVAAIWGYSRLKCLCPRAAARTERAAGSMRVPSPRLRTSTPLGVGRR